MNLTKLKTYAPKARQDFIQAMTERAAFYGIKQEGASVVALPITEKGDGVMIGGRAFSRQIAAQRKALEKRIDEQGFAQTMEALAYTWFNRLVAIRYMEVQGYFDHGYRVLSPASHVVGGAERPPEILDHAEHVDLPGLDKQVVVDLKLDGNKDSQLYRLLLLGQCHALHATMPFIFPRLDDETELLLPENLLHTDSLIRKLASEITDDDCQSVEILGWLYQFYIADKKEEVLGRKKAVPTEDIPAVTQLFTPHWIVRYLVENSLGRLWLLNRPGSRLREQMPYYIEGEAETDFLKITKPEDIRLLDPAVGSGHMLSYAFDLLFAIYVEAGHAPGEIPALILEHNLHGLDICPRAAQLAALTLVLKGREKSRRFFASEQIVQPRILALKDVYFEEGELREYVSALNFGDLFNAPMLQLVHQFEEATAFGSLIQPCLDERAIAFARNAVEAEDLGSQLFLHATHRKVVQVLEQATALSQRYHVVVTNPPYMGSKGMMPRLAVFAKDLYPNSRSDLSAAFIERSLLLVVPSGFAALITMQSWMFLSSLKNIRQNILAKNTIINMAHCGTRAFDSIGGEVVSTTAFVIARSSTASYRGTFVRLTDGDCESVKSATLRDATSSTSHSTERYSASAADFLKIPGQPIAYWASRQILNLFSEEKCIGDIVKPRQGMSTNDNARFLRQWFEVDHDKIGLGCSSSEAAIRSGRKWFPYNKGGPLRKWYGNKEYVVNWRNDGEEVKRWLVNNPKDPNTSHWSRRIINTEFYFKEGITWADITTTSFAARHAGEGSLFDVKGSSAFPAPEDHHYLLAFMNCVLMNAFMMILNPTVTFQVGDIARVPFVRRKDRCTNVDDRVTELILLARADWDNVETSWDFCTAPLLRPELQGETLEASWHNWEKQTTAAVRRMQELETENNRVFIDAYGLGAELQPDVPAEQITLARPDVRKDVAAFLSYAVGCMMGRYSLDRPGLILASAGESWEEYLTKVGRPAAELRFAPDDDGIIPVLDAERFEDDVVMRMRVFLRATFGDAALDENVRFIETALGKSLRKYFLGEFYKDHRQTYKKRPIYWMFSSGKERAFQCLVYLHRYNERTLARMRTEYVIPLQGQIASRIEQLEGDKAKATSTSHRRGLQKEQDTLKKQQAELLAFDEKLKHAADQKITLDLDDGVKVNYGKFADLLADVDAVTGGSDE